MINLIETPQRADCKAEYTVIGDALTVRIGDATEIIDLSGLPEGQAEAVEIENLPVNPIVSIIKENDVISITVIRFYGEGEKEAYENYG